MILVDTSVWVEFLAGGAVAEQVQLRLESGDLTGHPFVRGELALGRLGRRGGEFLRGFDTLPLVPLAPHDVVLRMVETHALAASGIGWVDAHLLAACVAASVRLWTLDRSLRLAALRIRKPGLLHIG